MDLQNVLTSVNTSLGIDHGFSPMVQLCAPKREIFYVNVGDMSRRDARKYIKKTIESMNQIYKENQKIIMSNKYETSFY